ncbi:hypothetical protein FOBRF1_009235 [Fusarium oxysporum]
MARGESDPAILAAMARVTKATQRGMEKAKQQADQSKEDYEAQRRQFGPNQQLIIQKVDDICPSLQRKLEVIEQAVEDIPRGTFMETLTQRATSGLGERIDRSVNGMVAQFKVLLDSQTQAIPSFEQIDGSVRERTTASSDAIDEKLERLKVDLQEAICAVLTNAVKGLFTAADGKQTTMDTISEIKAASALTTQEIGRLQEAVELTKKEGLSKIASWDAKTHEEVNGVRSALITAKEEFLSQINSSSTDTKQGIEGVRTALDQVTSVAGDMINSVRDSTRLGLNDIERTLEGQSSKLVSIQDRVEQVATCTQSIEDTFDKSKTESEGAWNRIIQLVESGFAPLSTADGLLDAKQAILIKLDGLSQVGNAQLSYIKTAIESSFGKAQTRFGQLEQRLAERPTQSMLVSTLTANLDHAINRLEAKIAECKDMTVQSVEYRESGKTQQAQFKRDLESCQTAMCQAVRSATDHFEKLLGDKAIDQLQREYEAKLDAKDQEIKHLSEKVETLIANCGDKEAVNQLLKQQLSTRDDQLNARDELCKAREDVARHAVSKEASSHQETLRNLNNREKRSKLDLEKVTDQLESVKKELSHLGRKYHLASQEVLELEEELKAQVEQAEEEEEAHMKEIIWLKQRIRAPFEANEITKILHDMALQVMELDISPIAVLSGQAFVNELASQLLLTGSAGRFTSFVQEVNDEEWRCFIDVCKVDNVLPLPKNVCDKHENECPKVWVDLDRAPDKKVVYFDL